MVYQLFGWMLLKMIKLRLAVDSEWTGANPCICLWTTGLLSTASRSIPPTLCQRLRVFFLFNLVPNRFDILIGCSLEAIWLAGWSIGWLIDQSLGGSCHVIPVWHTSTLFPEVLHMRSAETSVPGGTVPAQKRRHVKLPPVEAPRHQDVHKGLLDFPQNHLTSQSSCENSSLWISLLERHATVARMDALVRDSGVARTTTFLG